MPYIPSGPIKSSLPSATDKMIPDAMDACTTGWKDVSMEKAEFVLCKEDQYKDKYTQDGLVDSYIYVAGSMSRNLTGAG